MFKILEISRKNSRKGSMVFKPSFNCFKNEKIKFIQTIKTRNFTLSKYIYIILSHSIFIERIRLKQKKIVLVV